MVDFTDLAGVSAPLKRLIEVVADGLGAASRPSLTRKNADAKAYEIRTIARAIVESKDGLAGLSYKSCDISIEANNDSKSPPEQEANVLAIMELKESKRQNNVKKISQHAAEEFTGITEICKETPDRDWIARFFRIAEDITTDQMQELWGRVLAGEIKRPKSYSLRALELLKNISTEEANIFAKVAKIVFSDQACAFIYKTDIDKYLEKKFNIVFADLLILQELGLIVQPDLVYSLQQNSTSITTFTCGFTLIHITMPTGTPENVIPVTAFTEIGRQLIQLLDKEEIDSGYIDTFVSKFQQPGVTVQIEKISH